ncbi:hypothetical protein ACSFA2_09365 [Variovorax sp. LT2P21]|uniref:hypothetical protein n=1 Tax=Variovorax sp. LT2P21 TaxID=3443731 RepID=UPI003F4601F2
MTVLCANCHTANRDRAMFCIGCAGKLPAFAATGPSALETVRGKLRPDKVADDAAPMPQQAGTPAPHAPRGLMMAVLLLGATVVALAAWISFGPERAAAPGLASAAAPPLQTLPATAVAAPAAVAVAPPPVQIPVESALSPGESTVPATPPVVAAPVMASAPPVAKPPVTSPTRLSTIRSAGDPRTGCEHLFFVLAARCEAEHCEQAAYARHPRCEAVRDQRRRDEARRNPTGG